MRVINQAFGTWYFAKKSARMRALAYMDVGGRAMQEQLPIFA